MRQGKATGGVQKEDTSSSEEAEVAGQKTPESDSEAPPGLSDSCGTLGHPPYVDTVKNLQPAPSPAPPPAQPPPGPNPVLFGSVHAVPAVPPPPQGYPQVQQQAASNQPAAAAQPQVQSVTWQPPAVV